MCSIIHIYIHKYIHLKWSWIFHPTNELTQAHPTVMFQIKTSFCGILAGVAMYFWEEYLKCSHAISHAPTHSHGILYRVKYLSHANDIYLLRVFGGLVDIHLYICICVCIRVVVVVVILYKTAVPFRMYASEPLKTSRKLCVVVWYQIRTSICELYGFIEHSGTLLRWMHIFSENKTVLKFSTIHIYKYTHNKLNKSSTWFQKGFFF